MEEVKLKPCPFCGGVAFLQEGMMGDYRVECFHCFAHTFYEDSEEKAIEAWNRRAKNE